RAAGLTRTLAKRGRGTGVRPPSGRPGRLSRPSKEPRRAARRRRAASTTAPPSSRFQGESGPKQEKRSAPLTASAPPAHEARIPKNRQLRFSWVLSGQSKTGPGRGPPPRRHSSRKSAAPPSNSAQVYAPSAKPARAANPRRRRKSNRSELTTRNEG